MSGLVWPGRPELDWPGDTWIRLPGAAWINPRRCLRPCERDWTKHTGDGKRLEGQLRDFSKGAHMPGQGALEKRWQPSLCAAHPQRAKSAGRRVKCAPSWLPASDSLLSADSLKALDCGDTQQREEDHR
ncbi:hypothetical protein Y1Q_0014752 [Alligator mississippiensis]|uniref:Uncharacterized protein n=1 Tax=Alligator mississippiensis TaxID=8496 RepID=A0A151M1T2_ALLMI|nr:hypothetical protein Y1Q_0014752 [Alligator mississippiensis]